MAYGLTNGHVIDDTTWLERSKRDPNTLRAQHLENGWI